MVPAKKVVAKTVTTKAAPKAEKEVLNTEKTAAPVKKTTKATLPTADERYKMIAEAAYYRALRRGFQNGTQEDDWLAAEREVDALVNLSTEKKSR
jgi:hypothetical protein